MFPSLYKRGLAGGKAQICDDTLLFRYKDEVFEFPNSVLVAQIDCKYVVNFGRKCYTAKVTALRKLKAAQTVQTVQESKNG